MTKIILSALFGLNPCIRIPAFWIRIIVIIVNLLVKYVNVSIQILSLQIQVFPCKLLGQPMINHKMRLIIIGCGSAICNQVNDGRCRAYIVISVPNCSSEQNQNIKCHQYLNDAWCQSPNKSGVLWSIFIEIQIDYVAKHVFWFDILFKSTSHADEVKLIIMINY